MYLFDSFQFLLEPFSYGFMRRALLVATLIGMTNGFLGTFIILRRQALIVDALSHSLLPGLAIASIIFGLTPQGLFIGGFIATLLVSFGGSFIARNSRLKEETSVAALYITSFSLGIILIHFSKIKINLTHFLFGNILAVGNTDIWIAYFSMLCVFLSIFIFQRPLIIFLFDGIAAKASGIKVHLLEYLLLYLTVLSLISSLQEVGVLLSLGVLILPPSIAYLFTNSFKYMLLFSACIGFFGSISGLYISFFTQLPSGPSIILFFSTIWIVALIFSPRYGLLSKYWLNTHDHDASLRRWDNHKNHDHMICFSPSDSVKK